MTNLSDIAAKNIKIQYKRDLSEYKDEIEAMLSVHSAAGRLRSGATIEETVNISKKFFCKLRDLCKTHLNSYISESLVVLDAEEIISSLTKLFDDAYSESLTVMDRIKKIVGHEKLCDEKSEDIKVERENTLNEVILFIDSSLIAKRNKGIKGLLPSIKSFVAKLFGSPG